MNTDLTDLAELAEQLDAIFPIPQNRLYEFFRLARDSLTPSRLRQIAAVEAAMIRLGKAVLAGGPPDDIGPPLEVAEEYYAASDEVKRLAVELNRKDGE